jgi:hypothetical protein
MNDITGASGVTPPAVTRGNAIVIAAMCMGWLVPMLQFWGAAWGPLRPFAYGPGDFAPSGLAFALAFIACFLPCALPPAYYRRPDGPRALRVYEAAGIRAFRALATNGDYINRAARRADPGYRLLRDAKAAQTFLVATESGERGHLVLLCMGVATAAYATGIGWFGWAVALTAGNLVFNLYPILLLRYNRARLQQAMTRWSRNPTRMDTVSHSEEYSGT